MGRNVVKLIIKNYGFAERTPLLRNNVAYCHTSLRWHQSCCDKLPSCLTWLKNTSATTEQRRSFLPGFSSPFGGKSKKLIYTEQTLLGYSMEQMYDIVADVESYEKFVPWCKKSHVTQRYDSSFRCQLTVGFPPVVEHYTSLVTLSRPHMVKSECFDGVLFNHLLTIWKFDNGLTDRSDTCMLDFFVEFEFRSSLHSHLAQMFFNEVVHTMVNAFLKRAHKVHGPPSIRAEIQKRTNYRPSD